MYMYLLISFGFVVTEGVGVACGGEEVACGAAVPISEGIGVFKKMSSYLILHSSCLLHVSLVSHY